jgi:hypothetical protein
MGLPRNAAGQASLFAAADEKENSRKVAKQESRKGLISIPLLKKVNRAKQKSRKGLVLIPDSKEIFNTRKSYFLFNGWEIQGCNSLPQFCGTGS